MYHLTLEEIKELGEYIHREDPYLDGYHWGVMDYYHWDIIDYTQGGASSSIDSDWQMGYRDAWGDISYDQNTDIPDWII